MNTVWILVLVAQIYKGGAALTIDGFVSKRSCEIAKTEIVMAIHDVEENEIVCLPRTTTTPPQTEGE